MTSTIHDYRVGHVDLESMWLTVQASTSAMLISLAHAQAERDAVDGVADVIQVPIDAGTFDV